MNDKSVRSSKLDLLGVLTMAISFPDRVSNMTAKEILAETWEALKACSESHHSVKNNFSAVIDMYTASVSGNSKSDDWIMENIMNHHDGLKASLDKEIMSDVNKKLKSNGSTEAGIPTREWNSLEKDLRAIGRVEIIAGIRYREKGNLKFWYL